MKTWWIGLLCAASMGVVCVGSAAAHAQPVPSAVEWTSLAGDEARTSTRRGEVPGYSGVRWVLSQTPAGETIRYIGPASVVGTTLPEARLFTAGVVAGETRAIAVDAESGEIEWMTPIPDLIYDSWSSAAIDSQTGVVLYAAGTEIIALRMSDGVEAWRTPLGGPPVNVSPLVTRDLRKRNRAFVTDYGGFGGPSWLYCINVSARDESVNPFDPGEVVWATPIGSSTGGTPAYLDGVVYVCSTGLEGPGFGEICAFDARAAEQPAPLWVFTNPIMEGFFGGLTVRERGDGVYVYAATYAFYGEMDSANLVKVDARTGAMEWSIASNRTDSIPIVLDDGRIVLATGIQGFGTVPMVQMFEDHGTFAAQAWNTATSTWMDANQDGVIDLGEFLLVGGWTTHPVLVLPELTGAPGSGVGPRLMVGSIPTGDDYFGPYTKLFEFDLSKTPAQAGFVVQQTSAVGSSPAMLGEGVYSVGIGGLTAVGARPPRADVNGDGRIDVEDWYTWEGEEGAGERDVDRDGSVGEADRAFLKKELRRNESREMKKGGR